MEYNLIERYLEWLGFKKFMIFHVAFFTIGIIMIILYIIRYIMEGDIVGAVGFVIAACVFYVCLRLFQHIAIKGGAEVDNYTFFFTGRRRNK